MCYAKTLLLLAGAACVCCGVSRAVAAPFGVVQDRYPNDPERGCFAIEAEDFVLEGRGAQGSAWRVEAGDLPGTAPSPVHAEAEASATGIPHGGLYIRMKGRNAKGAPGTVMYDGPIVAYQVHVTTPGTYRLYLRWSGPDANTDSVYAQVLDFGGNLPPGPRYFLYHGRSMNYYGGWVWDSIGLKERTTCGFAGRGDVAEWTITRPGLYIIRLAAREHDTAVDALVFQTDNLPPPGERTPGKSTVNRR